MVGAEEGIGEDILKGAKDIISSGGGGGGGGGV